MILGLLFLPVRIALNLIRILVRLAFSVFWLPIHIVTHHFFLFFMLFVVIVAYAMFSAHKEDKSLSALPKAPPGAVTVAPELAPGPATQPRGKAAPVKIDPVLKVEDGDSAFASDLYGAMNEQERVTYSTSFYWAMNSLSNGQAYQWTGGNINGTLMPTSNFTNHVGDRCRNFKEVLKVHTVEQKLSGIACDAGDGSWCKLKPNATPMCGLGGGQPGMMDSVKDSLKRMFR